MKPIFVVKIPDEIISQMNDIEKCFKKIQRDYHVIFIISALIHDIDFQIFNGNKLSLQKQIQLLDMFKECKIYKPENK